MDATADVEQFDDWESLDGRASVASSDWANLSQSSASSVAEEPLAAKDVANSRELWETWAKNQRLILSITDNVVIDQYVSQIISSVFELSCRIPHLWQYTQHGSPSYNPQLSERLLQITQSDPGFIDEKNNSQLVDPGVALVTAANALEICETALRVAQNDATCISDDVWASAVHDALIMRCAQGNLLGNSRSWALPVIQLETDATDHPALSQLVTLRKIRPRGAIPVVSPDTNYRLFAAVFSTRCEIASYQRDMLDHLALHAFSNMATSAQLAQLSELRLNLPLFGIMFDRNIVRFHVNWNVALPNGEDTGTVSLPLPCAGNPSNSFPFRELDLTRQDDALRIAFMLAAIQSYSQNVLSPAVHARIANPISSPPDQLPLWQGEITSEEKVAAWMHFGKDRVDEVLVPGSNL